ncbi:hypothetical protein ADUPG1_008687 [Aduncisulcus paluster]|uniref:EF-hand domain-containing protein n=1 Tax=Aduncisulcus paluster TaxID=2918883 RepID=A0ABQ5KWZ9_9EUKA|nr:hypothetical protein ADUPG1_008687 [Aduncisulcus paluster]|eukprot:gnl/Carplike_NY0171/5062_a6907_361.p1 GENE.gnl/Carplike_NY0171/5062_a6907_361~~gnl/Carplike_NY0171/5062_a6907_361.p1  ORF type:complete len:396 (+),score=102.59 gnl/Carplike_NY0171/5062_a6907_361:37-1224(+)
MKVKNLLTAKDVKDLQKGTDLSMKHIKRFCRRFDRVAKIPMEIGGSGVVSTLDVCEQVTVGRKEYVRDVIQAIYTEPHYASKMSKDRIKPDNPSPSTHDEKPKNNKKQNISHKPPLSDSSALASPSSLSSVPPSSGTHALPSTLTSSTMSSTSSLSDLGDSGEVFKESEDDELHSSPSTNPPLLESSGTSQGKHLNPYLIAKRRASSGDAALYDSNSHGKMSHSHRPLSMRSPLHHMTEDDLEDGGRLFHSEHPAQDRKQLLCPPQHSPPPVPPIDSPGHESSRYSSASMSPVQAGKAYDQSDLDPRPMLWAFGEVGDGGFGGSFTSLPRRRIMFSFFDKDNDGYVGFSDIIETFSAITGRDSSSYEDGVKCLLEKETGHEKGKLSFSKFSKIMF